MTAHAVFPFRRSKVSLSNVVLPDPGAGDQVQHQLAACGKARAVAGRQTIVLIQHVDFDFQHPALALTRRMGTRFAVAVVQVAVR
ncbi:Uncharacterised protein [Raoultella ornithinolytica]|nr:Uncharacterised protein [Raoultella ornithinolytica]